MCRFYLIKIIIIIIIIITTTTTTIINIFIAQIPYGYDQVRVTNIIEIRHNKLREADQLAIYKACRS